MISNTDMELSTTASTFACNPEVFNPSDNSSNNTISNKDTMISNINMESSTAGTSAFNLDLLNRSDNTWTSKGPEDIPTTTMNTDQDAVPPLTKFTLFQKLPPEIRCKIWALNMPGPRIVEIVIRNNQFYTYGPSTIPNLYICHESRSEALKTHPLSFACSRNPTLSPFNCTYNKRPFRGARFAAGRRALVAFNFAQDTLFLSNSKLGGTLSNMEFTYFRFNCDPRSTGRVRHLMGHFINMPFFTYSKPAKDVIFGGLEEFICIFSSVVLVKWCIGEPVIEGARRYLSEERLFKGPKCQLVEDENKDYVPHKSVSKSFDPKSWKVPKLYYVDCAADGSADTSRDVTFALQRHVFC